MQLSAFKLNKVNFLKLSGKLNELLYKKSLNKLSKEDMKLADKWTLDLIREAHPHWSDKQVQHYHENLLKIRAYAVDEWSRRNNPN
ncbi:MAG: hypothetical protein AAF984_03690 [Verrucomicrobiota bacterium]